MPLRPPAGAPNVLVILLDDVGFAASSAFGGPCSTPVAERLATDGLKFNRFHTTALCSPTRQALLLAATITRSAWAGSRRSRRLPPATTRSGRRVRPLAETLKLNGYSTAQFGKCHEVPVWETSPAGPFDAWPTGGGGFEYFYGFVGGETNQYYPSIYEGTSPVEPEKTPEEGYHFTEDMTDRAIDMDSPTEGAHARQALLRVLRARRDARAAPCAPSGLLSTRAASTRAGTRSARRSSPARRSSGSIPPECRADCSAGGDPRLGRHARRSQAGPVAADGGVRRLPRAHRPPHRSSRRCARRPRRARGHARLLHHRRQRGERRRDAPGVVQRVDDAATAHPPSRRPSSWPRSIDDFGTPKAYNHYAVGWAHAMDTPYQWTKQVASHWGGTRNGTIIHWPNGIKTKGEVRAQFHHVIDVAPTVLDAAGVPEPKMVHGVTQKAMEGVSMRYAFDDAAAAERRATQYFEMFCNRGIYDKGWTAVTRHSTPWVSTELPPFADDTWELYDTNTDWSQAHDLAAEVPEKLEELKALFMEEARKYNVLPLDDRRVERFNSDLAGRPVLVKGSTQLLFGGMERLSEHAVINIKNKSHAVTAEIEVPEGGADGVIISQGGAFAGWSLYVKNGKPKYCYNLFGVRHFYVEGETEIQPGTHQVRIEFDYDGGGLGKGGTVSLYLDGDKTGEGRVEGTVPMMFSGDETCDVGSDTASPVSDDYTSRAAASPAPSAGYRSTLADGRRRPRPSDLAGRAPQDRNGPAVAWPDPAGALERPAVAAPAAGGVRSERSHRSESRVARRRSLHDGQRGSWHISRTERGP